MKLNREEVTKIFLQDLKDIKNEIEQSGEILKIEEELLQFLNGRKQIELKEKIPDRNNVIIKYRLQHPEATLREIAKIFDMSHQNISDILHKANKLNNLIKIEGINLKTGKRIRKKVCKINSIENVFNNSKLGFDSATLFKLFPKDKLVCNRCGYKFNELETVKNRKIHFHHKVYPAKSMNDIEILCNSYHVRNHIGKITNEQEKEIVQKYNNGINTVVLSKIYNVTPSAISYTIKKIKYNLRTIRETQKIKLDGRYSKYNSLLPQIIALAKQELTFKEISRQLSVPIYRFYNKKFIAKIIELANKSN